MLIQAFQRVIIYFNVRLIADFKLRIYYAEIYNFGFIYLNESACPNIFLFQGSRILRDDVKMFVGRKFNGYLDKLHIIIGNNCISNDSGGEK